MSSDNLANRAMDVHDIALRDKMCKILNVPVEDRGGTPELPKIDVYTAIQVARDYFICDHLNRGGNPMIEQLTQLFRATTWDGNLISKDHRDRLVKKGLAGRSCGFNFITAEGIKALETLDLISI